MGIRERFMSLPGREGLIQILDSFPKIGLVEQILESFLAGIVREPDQAVEGTILPIPPEVGNGGTLDLDRNDIPESIADLVDCGDLFLPMVRGCLELHIKSFHLNGHLLTQSGQAPVHGHFPLHGLVVEAIGFRDPHGSQPTLPIRIVDPGRGTLGIGGGDRLKWLITDHRAGTGLRTGQAEEDGDQGNQGESFHFSSPRRGYLLYSLI